MCLAISVLIIDDHRMFREGIRSRLEEEPDMLVVGEAASSEEALKMVKEKGPAVVILDIRLQDSSGIELARLLRNRWPDLKILILTGYDFDQYVRAMVRVGIDGYLLKDAPQSELVEALRAIMAGGAVLPPNIASKVMKGYASQPASAGVKQLWELTVREIEVLELLHQGLRNAEIAQRLAISPRTVESHVRSVISKLGALSRMDAVRIAADRGLYK